MLGIVAAIWLAGFAVGARALATDRTAGRVGVSGPAGSAPGSARDLAPGSARGAPDGIPAADSLPVGDLRLLSAALEPVALAGLLPQAGSERARAWAAAVKDGGSSPVSALGEILPPTPWFQARLIMERDEAVLEGNAGADSPSGRAYQAILDALPSVKDAAPAFEAALTALWTDTPGLARLARGPVAPLARSQRWMPPKDSLDASHRYALDIFYTNVRRSGAEETGPAVRSMTRGIVVAAAGDWKGGDELSSYLSGGLSPKSGNGAIVFCPDDGRFYAYFHLKDVNVRPGQLIPAGQLLGHGGNTGANARKKGHGEHLHIEIHTGPGEALSSYDIRSFVIGLK